MYCFILGAAMALTANGRPADAQDITLVPYDAQTMAYPVTPEQALASARSWFGDPQLQLTLAGVERQEGWPDFDEYVLESSVHRFKVRCADGHVRSWRNRQVTTSWTQAINTGVAPAYSEAQLEQIATAFAATHYPGYAARNMRLLAMDDGTATFVGELAGGVLFSGNVCKVSVCEFTGEVKEYLAHATAGVTVGTIPGIPSAQAESAALDYLLGSSGVQSALTVGPSSLWVMTDDLGVQRLVWFVDAVTGPDPDMTFAMWQTDGWRFHRDTVVVDAHTSEVVDRVQSLGSNGSRKPAEGWRSRRQTRTSPRTRRREAAPIGLSLQSTPCSGLMYRPIIENGTAYLHAGYMRTARWNAEVAWRDGALHITTADGRIYVLRPARSATPSMVVRRARAYISPNTWELLTGWKCTYSPARRMVSLVPPGTQQTVTITPRP
jgi:hypothetical protein